MPDTTGYVNENVNPHLNIGGVPDDAEALVIVSTIRMLSPSQATRWITG